MKRAIIYYSLSNNTKDTAEKLGEKLGADVYRIDLAKPLPANKAGQMLEGGRQATFGIKPEITGVPDNLAQYDELIIGTPIWAGKCASPFNTLLDSKDVCEKVTAVFTYSGGGDNANCIKTLKTKLPNLKYDVALADSRTKLAVSNEEKLAKFVDSLSLT